MDFNGSRTSAKKMALTGTMSEVEKNTLHMDLSQRIRYHFRQTCPVLRPELAGMSVYAAILVLSQIGVIAAILEVTNNDVAKQTTSIYADILASSQLQSSQSVKILETSESVQATSTTGSLPSHGSYFIETSNIHEVSNKIEGSCIEECTTTQDVHTETMPLSQSTNTIQLDASLQKSETIQTEAKLSSDISIDSTPTMSGDVTSIAKGSATLPEQPHGNHDINETVHIPLKIPEHKRKSESEEQFVIQKDGKHEGNIPAPEKPDEEGLTFNEWTQKVLAAAEKGKHDLQADVTISPTKQRKKKNYASYECGAKILANNPEATNVKSILNSNKDDYMNSPCKAKKWFVVELCEPIQAHSLEIASLELFSSQPKLFKVYLSDRFPTKDWRLAGEYETKDERAVQTFPIKEIHDYFAKYVRVDLVEHFGNEHYCPLTIFRMFGIAVIDYEEENNNDENEHEIDDDPDITEGEVEMSSKNLFTSAKDTVMNIVKKVLNVDTGHENNSLTDQNLTQTHDTELNLTTPEVGLVHPCIPDASIVPDGSYLGSQPEALQTVSIQPQVPLPGKNITDNVSIVTMLEDHEQVETVELPAVIIPDRTTVESSDDLIHNCSKMVVVKDGSIARSKLCQIVFLALRKCFVNKIVTKVGKSSGKKVKEKEEVSIVLSPDGTPGVKASSDSVSQALNNFKQNVLHASLEGEGSELSLINEDKVFTKELNSFNHIHVVEETTLSKILSSTESQSTVKPSRTDSSIQTETQSISESQDVARFQTGCTTQLSLGQESVEIIIEPSPVRINIESENMISSIEATPHLLPSWKSDASDLLEWDTRTVQLSSHVDMAVEHESDQLMPKTASVTIATASVTTPSSVAQSLLSSVTVADTSYKISEDEEPLYSISDSEFKQSHRLYNSVKASGEVRSSDSGDNWHVKTEDLVDLRPNATVIDEKVENDRKTDESIDLIQIPVFASSKRESAIMRLSNRIKALEQNVSLSSRFLEELSRRYKKQSEDMMKMLNKTMAKLNTVTLESEIKSKIHEDKMSVLDQRLENLTEIVHKLTQSFDNLNRQVTDRQMIWTSIEIIVIFLMMLFIFFRRRQTLSPEVYSLIESMPMKPSANLPKRRNSLSGPATPSKKMVSEALYKGGGLARFISMTALADPKCSVTPIVDSSSGQISDNLKKKKKKKHKLQENKLLSAASALYFGDEIEQIEISHESNYPESQLNVCSIPADLKKTSSSAGVAHVLLNNTSNHVTDKIGTKDKLGTSSVVKSLKHSQTIPKFYAKSSNIGNLGTRMDKLEIKCSKPDEKSHVRDHHRQKSSESSSNLTNGHTFTNDIGVSEKTNTDNFVIKPSKVGLCCKESISYTISSESVSSQSAKCSVLSSKYSENDQNFLDFDSKPIYNLHSEFEGQIKSYSCNDLPACVVNDCNNLNVEDSRSENGNEHALSHEDLGVILKGHKATDHEDGTMDKVEEEVKHSEISEDIVESDFIVRPDLLTAVEQSKVCGMGVEKLRSNCKKESGGFSKFLRLFNR